MCTVYQGDEGSYHYHQQHAQGADHIYTCGRSVDGGSTNFVKTKAGSKAKVCLKTGIKLDGLLV